MDKVVILARVSTDKQEYQRQVNELTDYCNRVGWRVEATFCNKISGAIDDFCKKHDLKLSRKEVDDLVDDIKDAADIAE